MLFFQPDGKHQQIRVGQTLLDAAQDLGVEITATCGGAGTCGKCRVLIKEGLQLLCPPSEAESNSLLPQDLDYGYRLACQVSVRQDGLVTTEVPADSTGSRHRLQLEGLETPVALNPAVREFPLMLEPPSLDRLVSLYDRVVQALRSSGVDVESVDSECLATMGGVLRATGWRCAAIVGGEKHLVSLVELGAPLLGIAFDIGTTKLAAYLIDLRTGKTLSKMSQVNPQVRFGEDVMTRLTYIQREQGGLERLTGAVRDALNQMIVEACEMAGVKRGSVREIVVVGNTLMHHLFLGIDPMSLAYSPYLPVISAPYQISAKKAGLEGGTGMSVYLLPNVAGFVGADCVADVMATGLDKPGGNRMVIDIGTNTELVLSSGNTMWSASCPSGPAFEGAHIQHGMRALSGAIEHVSISRNLDVSYSTVDQAPARGICGSGVVDVLSEMAKRQIVDSSGRMSKVGNLNGVVQVGDYPGFLISRSSENAIKKDITFTQKDVREVQMAKGAIATGIKILLKEANLSASALDEIYVAGAFGSYIGMASAIAIGMLPVMTLSRIKQVGNAAGTGARMCLVSRKTREAANEVAKRMKYIELAQSEGFQDIFLKSLELRPFS